MVVKKCRENLRGLKFGWMKFPKFKNEKFLPGFIHPPDKDGKLKAQWILETGHPSSKKRLYFELNDNLPEDQKEPSEKSALEKFNNKFVFDFK